MSEAKTSHLDDFTLLRYVAFDLSEDEHAKVAAHVETCGRCQETLREIEELDGELRALAKNPSARSQWETEELPEGDPFRVRPRVVARPGSRPKDQAEFAARAVAASEAGAQLAKVVLLAARASSQELEAMLTRLDLSDGAHRFGLLYALQTAGTSIAESPTRFLYLGEHTLSLMRSLSGATFLEYPLVPEAAILAQAHQLVGQACLWTGDLERASSCFSVAYRFYERLGDELGIAKVEQLESQRRFFAGNGSQALVLASRARRTVELLGVEDEAARCRVAEGMAFQRLNRHAEAVESFESSLPVFERFGLWSNYVGAVNAMATSLVVLGRPDEARRQFARALRRLSRDQHRSWVPFIRKGLAEVLFSVGRYREAAISAAQAARQYSDCGMRSRSLLSSLFEVESWARAGEKDRAMHRLNLFRSEIAREGIQDPTLMRLITQIFAGTEPDFQMIAELRRSAEKTLPQRLGEINA